MKTGIAQSSLLSIDKTYYVVEVETNENYVLANEFFKVDFIEDLTEEEIAEIESDIEYSLIIENDAKLATLQINKVDSDNNEYKIANVVFEITDETTGEIIGTVTTDENGIATIDDLKVTHTYSVREIETNYKYQLSDEAITSITLTADEITSITFENEKIKRQVKVIKVDKDDNTVLIPNVEFEILNCDMEVIETLITDENRRGCKF